MRSGEDILTTPSKIMDYLRGKVSLTYVDFLWNAQLVNLVNVTVRPNEIMYACFVELQC